MARDRVRIKDKVSVSIERDPPTILQCPKCKCLAERDGGVCRCRQESCGYRWSDKPLNELSN